MLKRLHLRPVARLILPALVSIHALPLNRCLDVLLPMLLVFALLGSQPARTAKPSPAGTNNGGVVGKRMASLAGHPPSSLDEQVFPSGDELKMARPIARFVPAEMVQFVTGGDWSVDLLPDGAMDHDLLVGLAVSGRKSRSGPNPAGSHVSIIAHPDGVTLETLKKAAGLDA